MTDTERMYEIWFADGSQVNPSKLFRPSEISEYAERFDFDAAQLIAKGEIDFVEDGQIIGGVHTIDKPGGDE